MERYVGPYDSRFCITPELSIEEKKQIYSSFVVVKTTITVTRNTKYKYLTNKSYDTKRTVN